VDEIVGKEFKYLEVPFKNVLSRGLYATVVSEELKTWKFNILSSSSSTKILAISGSGKNLQFHRFKKDRLSKNESRGIFSSIFLF